MKGKADGEAGTDLAPHDDGGPFDRFREATRRILSVSREEMAERERIDRLTRKPRGPKPRPR